MILVSVLVSVADPGTPNSMLQSRMKLEARAGIEPAHRGFADLGLTTWQPRLEQGRARCRKKNRAASTEIRVMSSRRVVKITCPFQGPSALRYRRFFFWPVVADSVEADAALLLFMFSFAVEPPEEALPTSVALRAPFVGSASSALCSVMKPYLEVTNSETAGILKKFPDPVSETQ